MGLTCLGCVCSTLKWVCVFLVFSTLKLACNVFIGSVVVTLKWVCRALIGLGPIVHEDESLVSCLQGGSWYVSEYGYDPHITTD